MSERDELIARLRMMDTDDRRLPFHDMRLAAADLLERDGAEITALAHDIERHMKNVMAEHDARIAAEAENARLKAGGCARDQRITQYCAEAAAARAALAQWQNASQCGHPDPCTLGPLCPYCEIGRLRATLAEAQRDAARYRWLRDNSGADVITALLRYEGEEYDGLIDAARDVVQIPPGGGGCGARDDGTGTEDWGTGTR